MFFSQQISLLSEKNEIPYEKDEKMKMSKSSSKPVLVIKEPNYETKTSTSDIKDQASKTENATPELKEVQTTQKPLPSIVCPHKDASKPLFSLPCFATANCGFLGKDMLCCDGRCLKGVKPPKADADHERNYIIHTIQ